ncbi:hypothetical protein T06_7662 [Trichinella sp. T6]|nr:hypothetical protein T06_7662 [Trichinella sp. T6]
MPLRCGLWRRSRGSTSSLNWKPGCLCIARCPTLIE